MKTFLKKNALLVFALLLAAGTMSFKAMDEDILAAYWYERDPITGNYNYQPQPIVNCPETKSETICALGFDTPQSYVDDTMAPTAVSVVYRPE